MKHVLYFLKQIRSYAGFKLYINLAAMVCISLLEGIGIILLIPLIAITGIVSIDVSGTPIANIVAHLQSFPQVISLPTILIFFVVLVIIQNVIERHVSIQNATIQHGFFRRLRMDTYKSLMYAKWPYFINKRKSDLINLLTAEIARASAGTNSFLQFITAIIFTLIQILIAFWLSVEITLFVIISGLILIFLSRTFIFKSIDLGNRTLELGKQYLGGITDQINGIKDIKSNSLEASRIKWYMHLTKSIKEEQIAYTKLKTKSQLYYKMSSAILIAAFIYVSITMFNAHFAQLLLIIIIFSRLWPRVAGIQAYLEQIASSIPALKAVQTLQEECRASEEFSPTSHLANHRLEISESISIENVHFTYENKERYALHNINVTIPKHKMTAVVGPSGAGKSTLIDLIMGLHEPDKGKIYVDGKEVTSEQIVAFRQSISYVPQDPFLFNATIKDNLQLVKPDATEEHMWEALELASAQQFVKQLPQQLDTLIGDRGVKLSGGERQRLVLARAILRKPSVLILDEATSALDHSNEANIQQALERLKRNMTIIVIAHRLSTIKHADQIVVLDQGKVVQIGEYQHLANTKESIFNHLLTSQINVSH